MRFWGKFILWVILGALFGTAIGVLARRLGYADPSGGMLAGMIAAPVVIMFLLLVDYIDELALWAVGGAIVGGLTLSLLTSLGMRVQGANLTAGFTVENMLNGAAVGAVLMTWLGAGGAVFKRGSTGVIGLLLSVIAGAFLGAAVWWLGDLIGGWIKSEIVTVNIFGLVNTWQWGETIAGVPVAVLIGTITTNYLCPQGNALYKEVGGRTLTRHGKTR
jgi:hypothetical protein